MDVMRKYYLLFFLLINIGGIFAQKNVIDRVVAMVGDQPILKSDIEIELMQGKEQGIYSASENYNTMVLENLLIKKLLLAQAEVDSITASPIEVENMLNEDIRRIIANLGSKERMERYFGRDEESIRNTRRPFIREQLITRRMQERIVEKVRVTPSEIKLFYNKLPADSLPEIPDQYELQQIVFKPLVSNEEKERVRNQLRTYREQVLSGEKSFSSLAVLYSADPGSATRGGELDYSTKAYFAPEFADAAFNLKVGKISKIVETEYGFHIIQMMDKKGEYVKVRHILIVPNISEVEKNETLARLDTLRNTILENKMSFEDAAYYYSSDKNTRNNGGLMADQESNSKISRSLIGGSMAQVIDKMKTGEISRPFVVRENGREEFKIVKLKEFYPKHKANLEDDWMYFEQLLQMKKQQELFRKWIKEKQAVTYIHISDAYMDQKFIDDGWIK